tara:strand:+ start:1386 stop:1646 length:261 start_codon:yes stop_codon:yes gene_type:complete
MVQEVLMNTEGLKILKARLWDQRNILRDSIKHQDSLAALNELDELYLIENEVLEQFESLRDKLTKDIKTVEDWLKQLDEFRFETRG